jgi:hypothetical protein
MFSHESLIRFHRSIKNGKFKALWVNTMRLLGLRRLVIRMDIINLCNLCSKMCYYFSDHNREKNRWIFPFSGELRSRFSLKRGLAS